MIPSRNTSNDDAVYLFLHVFVSYITAHIGPRNVHGPPDRSVLGLAPARLAATSAELEHFRDERPQLRLCHLVDGRGDAVNVQRRQLVLAGLQVLVRQEGCLAHQRLLQLLHDLALAAAHLQSQRAEVN